MKELQREFSGHLTQGHLQGKRGPAELPSRSKRHSQGLEEEDQAIETKQWDRWSELSEENPFQRKEWVEEAVKPLPSMLKLVPIPSPSPLQPHPADEWLHNSMESLSCTISLGT